MCVGLHAPGGYPSLCQAVMLPEAGDVGARLHRHLHAAHLHGGQKSP